MKSIFVQISSYQDYELAKTIRDCLDKSSGEYDIHFGISLVFTKENIDILDSMFRFTILLINIQDTC